MATVHHLGYFPSCIQNSDGSNLWPSDEFSLYMIGMSLEEAMATYWKVNAWDFYCGNSELDIEVEGFLVEEEDQGAENEKDLVCYEGGVRYSISVPPYEDPDSVAETITCNFSVHFSGGTGSCLFYNELYYPQISFFWINNPAPITNVGIVSEEYLRFFCEINWQPEDAQEVKYRIEFFPSSYWTYA